MRTKTIYGTDHSAYVRAVYQKGSPTCALFMYEYDEGSTAVILGDKELDHLIGELTLIWEEMTK